MGGDFQSRLSVAIECEQMTPELGMPFFSNHGSFASLACGGYVERSIQVAADSLIGNTAGATISGPATNILNQNPRLA